MHHRAQFSILTRAGCTVTTWAQNPYCSLELLKPFLPLPDSHSLVALHPQFLQALLQPWSLSYTDITCFSPVAYLAIPTDYAYLLHLQPFCTFATCTECAVLSPTASLQHAHIFPHLHCTHITTAPLQQSQTLLLSQPCCISATYTVKQEGSVPPKHVRSTPLWGLQFLLYAQHGIVWSDGYFCCNFLSIYFYLLLHCIKKMSVKH